MTNVPIAFEIIIQHFSGDTVPQSKTEIKNRVLKVHEDRGGLPECAVKNLVPNALRFLNHFGLAEKPGGYWRIKSVDDMCARLRALVHNPNIGDEGVGF